MPANGCTKTRCEQKQIRARSLLQTKSPRPRSFRDPFRRDFSILFGARCRRAMRRLPRWIILCRMKRCAAARAKPALRAANRFWNRPAAAKTAQHSLRHGGSGVIPDTQYSAFSARCKTLQPAGKTRSSRTPPQNIRLFIAQAGRTARQASRQAASSNPRIPFQQSGFDL